ncbi:Rv1733c family protein [Streptomyces sp. NBC_00344]|uniref:Rv1733c family protein n=1 Tax=Streptomyces sp. NBC_00344 TaxID=2975720 RepID=UPI002E23513F
MRTASGVWRWRHNPLRRGTDLAEAWVALVAVLLIVLAVPVVGWFCGTVADGTLRDLAQAQHRHRHPTTATVVRALPGRSPVPNPDGAADAAPRGRAAVHWTGVDGRRHTGALSTFRRHDSPGDRLRIWTDDHGRIVTPPMGPATTRAHAVLAGFGAAAAAAGIVVAGRRLVVWRLVQRRYVRIDRDWAEAGPDWGRTGTGS